MPPHTNIDPRIEKLLYSYDEAAYALSISARTVRLMVATKRITARKIGARKLIPVSELRRISRQDTP